VASSQDVLVGAERPALPWGWPVFALFLGFPVWWALGLAQFIWPVLATPMLLAMIMRGHIRVPRGFGIWILFLLWMLASSIRLDEAQRWIVFLDHFAIYGSATVLFLYVFNASPQGSLSLRNVLLVMNGFWAIVVVGGFLGLVAPGKSFTTPMEVLLPGGLSGNPFVHDLVHPDFAQVQDFLGYPVPRPTAPFVYTNEWGANIALLTPFALAAWGQIRSRLWRRVSTLLLFASVIPIVVSLNRGLWLSLGFGLAYASVRLALQGRAKALGVVVFFVLVTGLLVATTPLGNLFSDRLTSPQSNGTRTRAALYEEAATDVLGSPLLGFGAPRPSSRGSNLPSVGTHGQLWLVLVSNGIPGAILFYGWFLHCWWASRRGRGVGLWIHVVLLIALVQAPYYGMMPVPIHLIMIAAALVWRDSRLPAAGERGRAREQVSELVGARQA
jgi:hypothetical protein